jgi:Stealth protein CR2, conserved region 2/Stealth protein CR1, conserved region 1
MQKAAHSYQLDIDAVITWVNGADPVHAAKRAHYMGVRLHENGINPHRWICHDELNYCLRSIANHAPWIRTIWIITDAQTPDLSDMPADLIGKIKLVDHTQIFAGFTDVLPTFNSLSIESMMWRIPTLAEHFIYFNDDVFLTAPLKPSDVFSDTGPVLRGKWVDYQTLEISPVGRNNPALFNHYTQINAAKLSGFQPNHLFSSAHVIHPLRRSVFEALFNEHRAAFIENSAHRFRDIGQFQPQGLHNHACIAAEACLIQAEEDHVHVRSGAVIDYPLEDVRTYFRKALLPEYKFLCINDIAQIEAVIPETRSWIESAISAA